MGDTSLIFNLLAVDRVSGVLGGVNGSFGKLALGIGVAAAAAGDKMVTMAAGFQQGITRLQTGAGETQANLKIVSDGILKMAGDVGESTKDLNAGMYLVESAGFHGAEGLKVLKVAAEGAKVGNADMATVADAVTTALNAYHQGASHAAEATNALIAAEGQGKTNLEALSGALSTVAPIASVAHVSLNEVLGAMATMTGQGTDAAAAATYLKQTIGALSNPTGKASQEMKSLGLDATKVGLNLGKNGLASTLEMITDAIQHKMGPAGTVLIEHLKKASANTSEYQKVLANLPPSQQTYIGALATMVGGTKSMQAALQLTGDNMKVFQHNTDVINEKVREGGNNIEGWSQVQKNFNQHLAEAKGQLEAVGIKIGTALLPHAQQMLDKTMSLVTWFTRHKEVTKDLAIAIGTVTAAYTAYRLGLVAYNAYQSIVATGTKIWAAAQWILNFAMDANPVGAIILGIMMLVGVIILIATKTTWFQTAWKATWGFIKGIGEDIGHWFAGPFADFFVGVWHKITGAWDSAAGFFKGIGAWFSGPFAGFFVGAWHKITGAFDAAVGFMKSVPGRIMVGLKAFPGMVRAAFLDAAHAAGYALGTIVRVAIHLPGQIMSAVGRLRAMAVSWISTAWTAVTNWITTGFAVTVGFFRALPGRIITAVATFGSMAWAWMSSAWTKVTGAVTSGITAVVTWVQALPGQIIAAVAHFGQMAWQWMSDSWHRIITAITTGGAAAVDWFAALPGKIWDLISGLPGKMLGLGGDIIQGLINGVESMAGRLWGLASEMASKFAAGFKDALGISSPSKVMHNLAHKDVGDGLVNGSRAAHGKVADAGKGLGGQLIHGANGAHKANATERKLVADLTRHASDLDKKRKAAAKDKHPATHRTSPVHPATHAPTLGSSTGDHVVIELKIVSDGSKFGDAIADSVRATVRQKGAGNVQVALGRGKVKTP